METNRRRAGKSLAVEQKKKLVVVNLLHIYFDYGMRKTMLNVRIKRADQTMKTSSRVINFFRCVCPCLPNNRVSSRRLSVGSTSRLQFEQGNTKSLQSLENSKRLQDDSLSIKKSVNIVDGGTQAFKALEAAIASLPADLACKYEITALLGYGGNGFVAEARLISSTDNQGLRAIKFLRRDPGETDLPLEVKILRTLNHPNVCKFYENFLDDNFYYVVMERVGPENMTTAKTPSSARASITSLSQKFNSAFGSSEGKRASAQSKSNNTPNLNYKLKRPRGIDAGNLYEFLENLPARRADAHTARHLFSQIIAAYSHVVDNGYLYLDFRPENLLVDEKGTVKLIDFGMSSPPIVKQIPQREYFEVYGTVMFSAPEIVVGRGYIGQEAEVWALGVILYLIVTGMLPFKDEAEIIRGVLNYPSMIELECRDLLDKMLKNQPDARITLEKIKTHAWLCSNKN